MIWGVVERRRIALKNRELAHARFDLANEAERERRRIARDLHDQTLADLRRLMLMSDEVAPPENNVDFRREIESVSTEIRRICEDLSPSVLENVGLAPALEFLLQRSGLTYEFSAREDLEEERAAAFAPATEMQIYRIAQEVLSNVKRHSNARRVSMKIDGAPFNPSDTSAKGRGVSNIKSRAALIDAEAVWLAGARGENVFRLVK